MSVFSTRYRGVRDPRAAGPGQVWVEEIDPGMPGEEMRVRPLDPRYDLRRHSPDGFDWSYAGSGPAQLALAILADAIASDRLADALHQEFKRQFVSQWRDRWLVDRETVQRWAAAEWARRATAERAAADAINREAEEAMQAWRDDLDDQAVSDGRAKPFGQGGPPDDRAR